MCNNCSNNCNNSDFISNKVMSFKLTQRRKNIPFQLYTSISIMYNDKIEENEENNIKFKSWNGVDHIKSHG